MEKKQNPDDPSQKKSINEYARYSNFSIQMIAVIVLGTYCGIKLDQYLSLKFPVFTLVLSLLSVVFAVYLVIRIVSHPAGGHNPQKSGTTPIVNSGQAGRSENIGDKKNMEPGIH